MMPLDAPHATSPDDRALREAQRIILTREPSSEAARTFIADVVTAVTPHLGLKRSGPGIAARVTGEIGVILAGLMKQHFGGHVVSAQQNNSGDMWRADASPFKHDAFWGRVRALEVAGMIGKRDGIRIVYDANWFDGEPAKLWPTAALLDLAARHGVTKSTVGQDWRMSAAGRARIERNRPKVDFADLIAITSAKDLSDARRRVPIPEHQAELAATMRAAVAALNAHVAKADVRGCRAPVFKRSFQHDLRLGGRHYAIGDESFQSIRKSERAEMRINGEPVAEVDIHACYLTIFLAVTGTPIPEGDLYQRVGMPRDAVKAFVTQSFGAGKPAERWAENTPDAVRPLKIGDVRKAVLATYPGLADPTVILPRDVVAELPRDLHGWATGRYLDRRESDAVAGALGYVEAHGGIALPLHDGLVMPVSSVEPARRGLLGAFSTLIGVMPHLKITPEPATEPSLG